MKLERGPEEISLISRLVRLIFNKDMHLPRSGNLKVPEQRNTDDGQSDSKKSVKDLPLQATTIDEVRQVTIDGLSEKMRGTLHIPKDEKVNATIRLIDQGVNSPGAVTVVT